MAKPDPSKMYVVLDSHTNVYGTFREGDRVRGSHPAVAKHFNLFVEEGLSTDEMHEKRQQRFYNPEGVKK